MKEKKIGCTCRNFFFIKEKAHSSLVSFGYWNTEMMPRAAAASPGHKDAEGHIFSMVEH